MRGGPGEVVARAVTGIAAGIVASTRVGAAGAAAVADVESDDAVLLTDVVDGVPANLRVAGGSGREEVAGFAEVPGRSLSQPVN